MNGSASAWMPAATRYDGAVAVHVGHAAERRLGDDAAGRAHQVVEREHGRPLLRRDEPVEERLAQRRLDGEDQRPGDEQQQREQEAGRSARSARAGPPSATPAMSRASVRRRNRRRTRGHDQAADDLRAGDDRGRQPGDAVRGRVAVELEQVRLERVEGVDPDARP